MIATRNYLTTFDLTKHYNLQFLKDYYDEDISSMKTILHLYLEETPKELELIQRSLESNDAATAKATTHKIKTNITMLGIKDHGNFVEAMHLLGATENVPNKIIALFKAFNLETMKGLQQIEEDFFGEK